MANIWCKIASEYTNICIQINYIITMHRISFGSHEERSCKQQINETIQIAEATVEVNIAYVWHPADIARMNKNGPNNNHHTEKFLLSVSY